MKFFNGKRSLVKYTFKEKDLRMNLFQMVKL